MPGRWGPKKKLLCPGVPLMVHPGNVGPSHRVRTWSLVAIPPEVLNVLVWEREHRSIVGMRRLLLQFTVTILVGSRGSRRRRVGGRSE